MVGVFPVAVGFSVFGVIALLFFAMGGNVQAAVKKYSGAFQELIDRADMSIKAEEFGLLVLGASAMLWVGLVFLIHINLLISAAFFPVSVMVCYFGGSFYLRFRANRRINGFSHQLEMALRMLAGALRVGLGLRQAIILVTEEVPDPARREFMRIIGRTNIGINILDALDELAKSMPSHEMTMFARAVRVQTTTGGDLAKVLETLAATIRDRRKVMRKVSSLTAQGRMGGAIIAALPLLVGGFVMATQPDMSHALLHTQPGWIALAIVFFLESAAAFTLNRIMRFDV